MCSTSYDIPLPKKKSYIEDYIIRLYGHFHDDLKNEKIEIWMIRGILIAWKLNYFQPQDPFNMVAFVKNFGSSKTFFLDPLREEENCPYFECALLLYFAENFRSNQGCFFSQNKCGETCQSCKQFFNALFLSECHHFYRCKKNETRRYYSLFKKYVSCLSDPEIFEKQMSFQDFNEKMDLLCEIIPMKSP
jgi:hypothetical protein